MNTGKQFLAGRRQQKQSHTSVSKRVGTSMAAHEDISIDQTQLRSDRRGLENHYTLAIKYHDQFIDKVPNLPEGWRLVCEKWRADFEVAHKAIIAEIDELLVETSSSISKYDATLEDQMQDLRQQLKSQEQQFSKIYEKLVQNEQQFWKIDEKLVQQNNQFFSINGKFDQLSADIKNVLSIKQPSTQPSEDSSLTAILEKIMRQQESVHTSLNGHKKTSAEEVEKNNEDLKTYVK